MDWNLVASYLQPALFATGNLLSDVGSTSQVPYYFAGDMSGMGSKLVTPYELSNQRLQQRNYNKGYYGNIAEILRGLNTNLSNSSGKSI